MTSGPDGIPAFFVRDCCRVFAPALLKLFNLALTTSTFPAIWKRAKVCPVLKNGDPLLIGNYRPISVLCNFAKVFEISVYSYVFPLVRNLIAPEQHGFYANRSVSTNLVCFTQYLSGVLDSRGQIDVVYTDFSKAFDKMDHEVLYMKLRSFNFCDALVSFFRSYLSSRTYYVTYNSYSSKTYVGTSGVPQGSNLGPLLFNLFINDLPEVLFCQKLLYADDLKLFARIESIDDCIFLQCQLLALQNWCVLNGLQLNVDKCKVLSFSKKKELLAFPYSLGASTLERVSAFKDLGVMFDAELSFSDHINSIVTSAYKMLGFVVRNTECFTKLSAIKAVYFAFVRSRLEYCSVVWSPFYEVYKHSIESIQRKFLKYLSFKVHGSYPSRGYSNDLLLQEFQVLSMEQRRIVSALRFIVNLINGRIDCPLLLEQISFRERRPGGRYDVVFWCPQARTNLMFRSPLYVMTNCFNKICVEYNIFSGSTKELSTLVCKYFPADGSVAH